MGIRERTLLNTTECDFSPTFILIWTVLLVCSKFTDDSQLHYCFPPLRSSSLAANAHLQLFDKYFCLYGAFLRSRLQDKQTTYTLRTTYPVNFTNSLEFTQNDVWGKKSSQWARVLWVVMLWWEKSEENGQSGLTCQERYTVRSINIWTVT